MPRFPIPAGSRREISFCGNLFAVVVALAAEIKQGNTCARMTLFRG
jgi:hypothetical protein